MCSGGWISPATGLFTLGLMMSKRDHGVTEHTKTRCTACRERPGRVGGIVTRQSKPLKGCECMATFKETHCAFRALELEFSLQLVASAPSTVSRQVAEEPWPFLTSVIESSEKTAQLPLPPASWWKFLDLPFLSSQLLFPDSPALTPHSTQIGDICCPPSVHPTVQVIHAFSVFLKGHTSGHWAMYNYHMWLVPVHT